MTQSEEFTSFIGEELTRVGNLFAEKQMQYATAADPLANFRTGALLEFGEADYESMYAAAKSYLNKHIAFIYGHHIVDKTDESLRDMVVYGLIMLYMVKKHKQQFVSPRGEADEQ